MGFVIVGGGMAADAAVRGIRSASPDAPITILSGERHPPYDRPPLSKGLWRGFAEERIWRGTEQLDVTLLLNRRGVEIDRDRRLVVDDSGEKHPYDGLLLATGGAPIRLPGDPEGVHYFRTLDDYRSLKEGVEEGHAVAVVGGGFIGTELASVLLDFGCRVSLYFLEGGPLAGILPSARSQSLLQRFRERGVETFPGTFVRSIRRVRGSWMLDCDGARGAGPFDHVVAGLGIRPSVELALAAGLEVGDGIEVDEAFRTSDPRIFAAGDVASFPFPVLGERFRVEHEDHANQSGVMAGRAMAGRPEPYDHLPFFYSEVLGVGYEALGRTDPEMELVEVEKGERAVLYYREGGRVKGVLCWNLHGRMGDARTILRKEGELSPEELRERILPL